MIVFRALGFVPDRDILEHVCYDFADHELMERLRPSLEEAFAIQDQEPALDFIGKRGTTSQVRGTHTALSHSTPHPPTPTPTPPLLHSSTRAFVWGALVWASGYFSSRVTDCGGPRFRVRAWCV